MRPEIWAEIRRLHNIEKVSISEISRRMNLDRKTVRQAIKREHAQGKKVVIRVSKLDSYKNYIQNRVKEYPLLSSEIIMREIQNMGYSGSIRLLRYYLFALRPAKKEAFFRIETLPGEQAQVDWANCGEILIGNTKRKLSCFVMVMSFSRVMYLEWTLSQCLEDFLACHVHAFHFFKGCPKKILYDNLKTVVLARVGTEIRFNPKFIDFSGYYLFEPVLCAPGKGNEKGKVESGIKYIRGNFLAGRFITSYQMLKTDAKQWQNEVANMRIHATTRERPIDRFEKEKSFLKPLHQKDYDTSIIRPIFSNSQAFIRFDGNAYSVPYTYNSQHLTLKATQDRINIYKTQDFIASHVRSYEKYLFFEDPKHRQGLLASKRKARYTKICEIFLKLGPECSDYLNGLIHNELHLPYHLEKILHLVDKYGKGDVLQAISHALKFSAFGAPYIQNIIIQQRVNRGLKEPLPIQIPSKPQWASISVEEQDLSVYDELFDKENMDIQKLEKEEPNHGDIK